MIRKVTESFRASLCQSTGGNDYHEQLWGNGMMHAVYCVNRVPWSDGTEPYLTLTGKSYEFGPDDHVFGAKCIYKVPPTLKSHKHVANGNEGIWVGRDNDTGAHRVLPIKWDSDAQRWHLSPVVIATTVKVMDETDFPLRKLI